MHYISSVGCHSFDVVYCNGVLKCLFWLLKLNLFIIKIKY